MKTIKRKIKPTDPIDPSVCEWAVCCDVDGKDFDDRKPRTIIFARFRFPISAEDYINKCVPEHARSRCYIVHI